MAIYIDDKSVTKKELFERLRIASNSIPAPRRKVFQFPVKTDSDGNRRYLRRIMAKPEFSVYIPSENREVKVRYAVSQKKDKDQNFEYTPKNISLEAGENGEILIGDEMVYLFWYLNPINDQSPFRKSEQKKFYEFKDDDASARESNNTDELRITALSYIFGNGSWQIGKLRTLAKGMSIAGVDDMTDDVVKRRLKDLASNNPSEFINKVQSREVQFSGKIQEAIDKNIIQLKSHLGMSRWYMGGREVLPVQFGMDARAELDKELSERYYLYADELTALLEGKTVETNLSNPANDSYFEEEKTIETKSEMDAELWNAYQELKNDEFRIEKIKKWADLDINNPGLHQATRKAMLEHAEAIELYRKGRQLEVE